MSTASRIFSGYRALGFVSNHVPLAVRNHKKHKENYVVTCVGNAFHTYNCSRLGITSVSNAHVEELSCLAVDAYHVYTASGSTVYAYVRGRQVSQQFDGHEAEVILLLPFGQHLISVDRDSTLKIWDKQSAELYLELQFDNASFRISALLHPNTYLNKVLLASHQGALQLWNIRTSKLVYTFTGWKRPVTVLQQAPAVDVVAVGLTDGRVILHNLKYDETIMSFTQDWGPITSISFRTDGHPVMATGSSLGHIALWNLETRKLQSQMLEAHAGAVTGMQCLPCEPLMVTSSPDNSLKVWIFDQPDGGGRLLRQRSGHSAPPHRLRYHDNKGQNILSAGQDSTLRSFSTEHDRLNKSLGRASFNKAETKKAGLKRDQHRMPPVTEFASEPSHQSDWDSIACCHHGLSEVTTWHYQRGTMGSHRLCHARFMGKEQHKATAQSVTITSCGNFALVGYSSGHVDKFNMQSGIHRGSYGKPTAHEDAVRGLAVDALNQLLVTGGGDACVKFWKFKAGQHLATRQLEAPVARMLLHRHSSLLAVTLDDFTVVIMDTDTRNVARKFTGHCNTITDLTFSPDGRWLITAAMDSTLRVWDLPTGCLLDCFLLSSPVTSVAMSPTADFLATSHVDDLGVYLWSNMSLYRHVNLRPLPQDFTPQLMAMPSTSLTAGAEKSEDSQQDELMEVEADGSEFTSPEQLADNLVTLSLLPNSRWQNLLNLDIIKQRNKPKEAPKVPKAAPFFLPTIAGLDPKFAAQEEEQISKEMPLKFPASFSSLSSFGKLVWETQEKADYCDVIGRLKEMGPSAIDVEFRGLSPEGGGSVLLMRQFLLTIQHTLLSNRDFELAQSYLALFLKLHGDTIASEEELTSMLGDLQADQALAWQRLQSLLNQNLCLTNYLKSATF